MLDQLHSAPRSQNCRNAPLKEIDWQKPRGPTPEARGPERCCRVSAAAGNASREPRYSVNTATQVEPERLKPHPQSQMSKAHLFRIPHLARLVSLVACCCASRLCAGSRDGCDGFECAAVAVVRVSVSENILVLQERARFYRWPVTPFLISQSVVGLPLGCPTCPER